MMTYGLKYMFIKILFQVIYLYVCTLSYQQLASFSQGKSKHIYKKSKATAFSKYYYLIGQSIAISNQWSAVSGQRLAVSGQQSAVSGQRSLMLITALCAAIICHARVIQYYCARSNIRSHHSIHSCYYCAA